MANVLKNIATEEDPITTDSVPSAPRTDEELNKTEKVENIDNAKSRQQLDSTQETFAPNFKIKSNKKTNKPKSNKKSSTSYKGSPIIISHSSGIHFGPNINIHCNNSSKIDENLSKSATKTQDIESILKSQQIITEEQIQFASKHVGENWKQVARALNYSDGQIYQIYADYKIDGLGEVIYQLLLGWYRNDPDKATLGNLAEVLWQSQEFEVVHKLSQIAI